MSKLGFILLSISLTLSAWSKTSYLEVQVDVGSCINAGMLDSASKNTKEWMISAFSEEEGQLKVTSGATIKKQKTAELKYHPGFFSGPVFDFVVRYDDEATSTIQLKIDENKRGLFREDVSQDLGSVELSELKANGVFKMGRDVQGAGYCILFFR